MGNMPKIEDLCSIGMCVMKLVLATIVYTLEIGTPDYAGVGCCGGVPTAGDGKGGQCNCVTARNNRVEARKP